MDRRFFAALFSAFCILMLVTGCSDNSPLSVSRVKVESGDNQCALPGEEFEKELRIEVLGLPKGQLIGGKAKPRPVPNLDLLFVPVDGSSIKPEKTSAKTDITGIASVKIRAGKEIGDNYLKIIPVGAEDKSLTVRYVVGAKLSGGEQEGKAQKLLADPVSIQLVNADGKPAANVPVYFSILSSPESKNSAAVLSPEVLTDSRGVASTQVRLGKDTGEYRIGVEVADPKSGHYLRTSQVRVLGLDLVTVIISVVGGLAFFVFGMKLMADGLLKIAGENMKRILQFFSRNGIVAVLAGTVVTAVIQSSSATTVMVVGFINAGLLTLQQAVGIIFGANIGTTVTAQLISFNLGGIALPCVAIGFLMMIAKKSAVRGWGETVLGFGLLFFGMGLMSSELKALGGFPTFISLFRSFDCAPVTPGGFMPIGAVLGATLIGVIGTFLIQSSAAVIGIMLALASGGLLNFYTALPLLLGTNIGTTITMFLASLTANRVAKQATIAHFLFNCFGSLLLIISFYIPYGPERIPVFLYFINSITPGNVFLPIPQGLERHIAMAHTFFNIFTVLILMPLLKPFSRLCERLLPVRDDTNNEIHALEPNLLATPSVALEQVVLEIRRMVQDSWTMIDRAVNAHFLQSSYDADSHKALKENEKLVDNMQSDITNYLVQITRKHLTRPQSALIPLLMHCTNDAERIADHAETIMKLTKRLAKSGIQLSDVARADLKELWDLLDFQAKNVTQALGGTDRELVESALASERRINKLTKKYEKDYTRKDVPALQSAMNETDNEIPYTGENPPEVPEIVMENEREINNLTRQYEMEHVSRRNEGKCSVEGSVIFIELLWELERIGDHLANIAVRTPEIQKHYISLKK